MPQLIAMIIVVVGALIYMFQTFGGTGDKIEGIAQKSSILTEISNVKQGIQLALRSGDITNDRNDDGTADDKTRMIDLADKGYFAKQINDEVIDNTADAANTTNIEKGTNTYSAISFGGEDNPSMLINLVVGATDTIPGIRVVLKGNLADNGEFLESQIINDLKAVADVDITGSTTHAAGTYPTTETTATPGVFTIYYKDLPSLTK